MKYNICKTCGAKDGRCGMLINDECQDCSATRESGRYTRNLDLLRTDEEMKRTFAILEEKPEEC